MKLISAPCGCSVPLSVYIFTLTCSCFNKLKSNPYIAAAFMERSVVFKVHCKYTVFFSYFALKQCSFIVVCFYTECILVPVLIFFRYLYIKYLQISLCFSELIKVYIHCCKFFLSCINLKFCRCLLLRIGYIDCKCLFNTHIIYSLTYMDGLFSDIIICKDISVVGI